MYNIKSLAAGGIAGAAAKTAFAPFERVRILFQVQDEAFRRYSGSLRGAVEAALAIYRQQGFQALYRGHSLALARAVPHAAVGFTAYDHVKAWIMPTKDFETPLRRFLAGALAGLVALPITYPFDVVRVRMAVNGRTNTQPTVRDAIKSLWTSVPPGPHRLAVFYRGFPVTAAGSIPYRGGIFFCWETLHARAREQLGPHTYSSHRALVDFSVGALSGAFAQTATYPLEIVRRRQQITRSGSVLAVAADVWRQSGSRGFYIGLGLGLVKQVPMNAISLGTWQLAKRFLEISEH